MTKQVSNIVFTDQQLFPWKSFKFSKHLNPHKSALYMYNVRGLFNILLSFSRAYHLWCVVPQNNHTQPNFFFLIALSLHKIPV